MIGYKKLERNGISVDQHYLDAASEKRRYLYITIFFVFGSLLVNGIVHNVQELKWKGYEIAIVVFVLFCYLYMIKDLRKQISFNVYVVVVNFDTSRFIGFFQNMDGDTLFLKRFKTKKRITIKNFDERTDHSISFQKNHIIIIGEEKDGEIWLYPETHTEDVYNEFTLETIIESVLDEIVTDIIQLEKNT